MFGCNNSITKFVLLIWFAIEFFTLVLNPFMKCENIVDVSDENGQALCDRSKIRILATVLQGIDIPY